MPKRACRCVLFWCSTLPAVMSVMYKEAVLTDSIDGNYLNGWVALCQAVFF